MISKLTMLILIASLHWSGAAFSQSQSDYWGTGQALAHQKCPYKRSAGAAAYDGADDVREAAKELLEARELKTKLKSKLSAAKRAVKSKGRILSLFLKTEAVTLMTNHFSNGARCIEYSANNSKAEAGLSSGPYTKEHWQSICSACKPTERDATTGDCPTVGEGCSLKDIQASACEYSEAKKNPNKPMDTAKCKTTLKDLADEINKVNSLSAEYDSAVADVKIKEAELKEAAIEMKEARTEGTFCLECLGYTNNPEREAWGEGIKMVGAGIIDIVGQIYSKKSLIKARSDRGYSTPSNSYIDYLPGAMSILGGVYGGITGGTSHGTFGCAAGVYGNGNMDGDFLGNGGFDGGVYNPGRGNMWAYPESYYDASLSGGLYNQGQSPWGVGPNGALGANGGLALRAQLGNPLAGLLNGGGRFGGGLQMGGRAGGNFGLNNPMGGFNGQFNMGGQAGFNGGGLAGIQQQRQMLEMNLRAREQEAYSARLQLEQQQQQAERESQVYAQAMAEAQNLEQLQYQIDLLAQQRNQLSANLQGRLSGSSLLGAGGGAYMGGTNAGLSINIGGRANGFLGGGYASPTFGSSLGVNSRFRGGSQVPFGVDGNSMNNQFQPGSAFGRNNPIAPGTIRNTGGQRGR